MINTVSADYLLVFKQIFTAGRTQLREKQSHKILKITVQQIHVLRYLFYGVFPPIGNGLLDLGVRTFKQQRN
jgi:hypothetical protein